MTEISDDSDQMTTLLMDWRNGNKEAGDRLMAKAYQQLKRISAHHMQRERRDHTLQGTALVHELYLRLFGGATVDWKDRAHFVAVASQQLRRILVDHARGVHAEKRGGDRIKISLTQANGWAADQQEEDLVDVDEALRELEELDPRVGKVVELRFFGGLTAPEAAEVLGISLTTLKRDWEFARTWLKSRLMPRKE
jgi:RNA polymerase sigma factor (TIGR02999 family)